MLHKGMDMKMECSLHFSTTQLKGAIDFTRNKLLDWTLQLEREGIVGAGFSFNVTEKEQAKSAMNNFYNANIGVFGNVAGDASASHFNTTSGDLDIVALERFLQKALHAAPGLPEPIQTEAIKTINNLQSDIKTKADQSTIRKGLTILKEVLTKAGGDLVADAIIKSL